jgi:hypothetical protein
MMEFVAIAVSVAMVRMVGIFCQDCVNGDFRSGAFAREHGSLVVVCIGKLDISACFILIDAFTSTKSIGIS